jgi:hypothetical protein
MKSVNDIAATLIARNDFRIVRTGIDGGMGLFTKGAKKGMTVIWSYGGGWEHVSIDGKNRMPTWDEMCELKDMFWNEDECCVEYHPPKSEYVNNVEHCLHIWRPIEQYSGKLPMPPSIFTGLKGAGEFK